MSRREEKLTSVAVAQSDPPAAGVLAAARDDPEVAGALAVDPHD